MAEQPEKKEDLLDKLKSNKTLAQGLEIFRNVRIELVSGIFLLLGLILALFYTHLGGVFVGLAFGLCFFGEIHYYLKGFKELYAKRGVLKTLMLLGFILYLLLSVPAFVIAAAVGFGFLFFVRRMQKHL